MTTDRRIALCLSGHVRDFERTYPALRRHLLDRHDTDVFVHTWSVVGHQHRLRRPRPSDETPAPLDAVRELYRPARMLSEDNADVLARWRGPDPIYLADSQAEPQYIYSQLYSVNRANRLRVEHEAARGTAYDAVVRLRFDFELQSAIPDAELERVARERETIYVAHPILTRHGHPGGGGGCRICEVTPHAGPHGNDVCDLVAFGSGHAMDGYASLFDHCLEVYQRASTANAERYLLRTGLTPEEARTGRGYVYVPDRDAESYVVAFYPERLLREHLVGYRVLTSDLAGRIVRRAGPAPRFVKVVVPVTLRVPRAVYPAVRRLKRFITRSLGGG